MAGLDLTRALDLSSLKPVAGAGAKPETAPAEGGLDLSTLRPASEAGDIRPAPREDMGGQFAAGLATGIPNAISGLVDASERGRRMGLGPGADIIGGMIEPAIRPFLRKPTEVDQYLEPQGGKTLQEGMSAAHINPNDYFREPKTAAERI